MYDVVVKSEALYRAKLKQDLERDHLHEFIAIEPVSGDFFLGRTMSEAGEAARAARAPSTSQRATMSIAVVSLGHLVK